MDLITGLPRSRGKDTILTIVDHGCSRGAIFLPCKTTITGPGIAQLYLQHVYRWFGLPTRLISDRDPWITSHFGKALVKRLGISQNLSTTAHPQTDGLSERKNQWVEQYLRLVTSLEPESWADWLPLATLVHNNRQNVTTKLSPNQALLGYEPPEMPSQHVPSDNQMTEDRIATMEQFRKHATTALNDTANRNPVKHSQYQLRDQVWLEGTHLKLPHQSSKLAPKRYGPFRIAQEISPVAYRLALPASWRIHDVFHASLLTPYHETSTHGPNFVRPPPDLVGGEDEYEVERVMNHRHFGRARTLQFLIKWKGYPNSDNTWEPAGNLHADDSVADYWKCTKETHKRLRTLLLKTHQLPHSFQPRSTIPPSRARPWQPPPPHSHLFRPLQLRTTSLGSAKLSILASSSRRSHSPPSAGTTTTPATTPFIPLPSPERTPTPPTSTSSNIGAFAENPTV
jgi:hypothetical protein